MGSLDKDIIVIHVIRLYWDTKKEYTGHQDTVPGPVMMMPMGRPPHTEIKSINLKLIIFGKLLKLEILFVLVNRSFIFVLNKIF